MSNAEMNLDQLLEYCNAYQHHFKIRRTNISDYSLPCFIFEGKCNRPYELAFDLIEFPIVAEVEVYEWEKSKSKCLKKDIMHLYEPVKFNSYPIEYNEYNYQETGTDLLITTLFIAHEDLIQIAELCTFEELLTYLKNISIKKEHRPRKKVNRENPSEVELIYLINELDRGFSVEKYENDDGFYEGYLIEGSIQGDFQAISEDLLVQSTVTSTVSFADVSKGTVMTRHGEYQNEERLNEVISYYSSLITSGEGMQLHVYLQEHHLSDIRHLENFNQVLSYIKSTKLILR